MEVHHHPKVENKNFKECFLGTVPDNRTGRTGVETDTQLALLFAVYTVANIFPGDVTKCSSFFDFSLLYPQAHHHPAQIIHGNILKNEVAVALNRSLQIRAM